MWFISDEEVEHKDEIVQLTEEVLHAKGQECDDSISKLSASSHFSTRHNFIIICLSHPLLIYCTMIVALAGGDTELTSTNDNAALLVDE